MENLPVWSFEPNWSSDNLETLEWLTDILRSPTGAEQRRALRDFPRRTFEFAIALEGSSRAYFDNMVVTHGARDWYLPLWHDAHFLEYNVPTASTFLPIITALGFVRIGEIVYITDGSSRRFEVGEVAAVSGAGVALAQPLTNSWSANASVHPVRKARFTEQPTPRRESDGAITSQIRFRAVEQNSDAGTPSGIETYRSFKVLPTAPDESESLDSGYERILEELDNQVSIPKLYDSAGMSFPTQKHSWTIVGRAEHRAFSNLIYDLRGKWQPLWLPTFYQDFQPVQDVAPGAATMRVEDVGFTATGGPKESRRDVMIELIDGSRYFRRIVSAASGDGEELIGFDSPFTSGLKADEVLRISFMALSRLNTDVIEISHKTDIEGVSTVSALFRNTPDLRQVGTGF